MVSRKAVDEQLRRIGCNIRFWGRSEVNELGRILLDDEIIAECVNGEYANGFALMVATNHRVLLVDKKPMLYLTVEDLRYEMITEFNLSHRMLNATINIFTTNKALRFTSWNQGRLRRLLEYTQQRVLEMRQQQHMAQQFQAAAAAQYAQLHAANYFPTPSYAPNLASQPTAAAAPASSELPNQAVTPSAQYLGGADPNGAGAQTGAGGFQSQADASGQETAVGPIDSTLPTATVEQEPAGTVPLTEPVSRPAPQGRGHAMVSRFAAKRAALGTYTRSKLPSFRRHHDYVDNRSVAGPQPQSGEVYPQGYNPKRPSLEYGLPYEY